MARRKIEGMDEFGSFLALAIAFIILMIQSVFKLLGWIIESLAKIIQYAVNRKEENKTHKTSRVNNKKDIRSINKYDFLFKNRIRERGRLYYLNGNVTSIRKYNNKIKCEVIGTENYDVEIVFKNNTIDATCTCPYNEQNKGKCKHIYAALLKSYEKYGEIGKQDPKVTEYKLSNYEDKIEDEIEDDVELWGLTEEEKEIVKTTDYEPWDFEEEDMDEDSYYYEDDE